MSNSQNIFELGLHMERMVSLNRTSGGKVFYVSNNSSAFSNTAATTAANQPNNSTLRGKTPSTPLNSVDYAIGLCVAGRGDLIVVLPGHAETINAAASVALDVAGVKIVGMGTGSDRPTFTWATATDATITVTAANCSISNCIFNLALPSALISGIVVSAAGFRFEGNRVHIGTAGTGTRPLQFMLTTAAANYLRVIDNQFLEPALTPTTVSAASCAIKLVGGTGIQIKGNTFSGWYTTSVGAITSITTLNDNIEISGNLIFNQTASSTKGIVLLTGSTGFVVNNRIQILSGTAPITGDGVMWAGNYYAAAIATAGTLV